MHTTAVRFDEAVSGDVGVIGMEFAEPADFGDTCPLGEDDEAVLAGVAERLAAHGKVGRFGVRLIRNPLGLSGDEMLHETCDSAHRTLHCDVGERDALRTDDTMVQTAWQWKVVQGKTAPTVMRDCTVACQSVGEGHDIGHSHSEPDDFGND
ncbi:MAG: hypothetical protein JOZ49_22320 [Mycolicibacterium sp.]|nr:hypothetical protein [Mycolicibacterium sp.]